MHTRHEHGNKQTGRRDATIDQLSQNYTTSKLLYIIDIWYLYFYLEF